jgi:PKD repeat protein
MSKNVFLLLSVCFFFLTKLYPQISVPGTPESFKITTKSYSNIPIKILDAIDTGKLLKDDFDNGISNRYGILQQMNLNIRSEGIKTLIPDKGYIWRCQIQSPFTFSIGIQFSKFHLPAGATLFIYNNDHSQLYGAFTDLNNNSENQLAIAEFKGNNVTIEYFEPLNPDFQGELIIGSVSQAYRDIQAIMLTLVGINCPPGANWQVLKHAVCRMTFHDNIYEYFCSGSFVNNVRGDGTPYFLSANHCLSSGSLASTLVLYFNYESGSCNSADSTTNQTMSGSSLMATNSYSDFTLLKLKQNPPLSYYPYYAGWDASGRTSSNGTCIHHPGGSLKSIAIDNNPPTNLDYSINWDKGGVSFPNSHWVTEFDIGAVEEGSSGAPLFDDHKRIMGQLHGGDSTYNYFGKFSVSWKHSLLANAQLAYWLDPDNTNTLSIDGYNFKSKPISNFKAELTTVCTDAPVHFTDLSSYLPEKWKWSFSPATVNYVDGTDSSSQSPVVAFLNEGSYSVTLIVTNTNGADTLMRENYIAINNIINVRLSGLTDGTSICGYEFNNIPFSATGAYNYNFTIGDTDRISEEINSNVILLSLKTGALKSGSFESSVKVTGTQGSCIGSDSLRFKVVVPINDDIANAINLNFGENGPFSNQCATVELNEPHPDAIGCLSPKSWCVDTADTAKILHNTIWFTFTGPVNNMVTIATKGFDTRICVYDANNYQYIISGNKNLYTILDANDDRSSTDKTSIINNLKVEAGKKYWLQLDGNNGAFDTCYIDFYSNNVEAFPNPSKGVFNLVVSYQKELPAIISIYSVLGQRLFTKKVDVSNSSNQFSFDLSNYTPGVYFIGVLIDNREQRKKILIVK